MVLYTLIAAITIVLACHVKTTENPTYDLVTTGGRIMTGYTSRRKALNALCLVSVFVVLTLLAALRHEVGYDYGTYVVT